MSNGRKITCFTIWVTVVFAAIVISYAFSVVTAKEKEATEAVSARRIIDQSQLAMVVVDRDGVITSWSSGAEALFGLTRTQAVGKSARMLVPAIARVAKPAVSQEPVVERVVAATNSVELDVTVWPASNGAVAILTPRLEYDE